MHLLNPHHLTRAGVTLLLGSLILSGFAVFAASSSGTDRTASITVNRANKGDQLQAPTAVHQPSRAPAAARTGRPPFGCDPLFSSIAEPAQTRIYHRCTA